MKLKKIDLQSTEGREYKEVTGAPTIMILPSKKIYQGTREANPILDKLFEKGIFTAAESQEVQSELLKIKPQPVGLQWNGDFRFRYQQEERETKTDRNRLRFRLRLGSNASIADDLKFSFGFASDTISTATGMADPRSRNQSFDNSFSAPAAFIDYAYLTYAPQDLTGFSLLAGKMKNPVWQSYEMLFDNDITTDGLAVTYKEKNSPLFVNTGYFVLQEYSATVLDPTLLVIQPGVSLSLADDVDAKIAAIFMGTTNAKGSILLSNANNTVKSSKLTAEYATLGVDSELKLKGLSAYADSIRLYASFFQNNNFSSGNKGYAAGFAINEKPKAFADWSFAATYKKLEKDVELAVLPDSDFYSGATDVKGWELQLDLGLNKNTTFTLDYYLTSRSDDSKKESLLQADVQTKF